MMDIVKKIQKLYKIDRYFYKPHYEHAYYLAKCGNKDVVDVINETLQFKYKRKIHNFIEDVYFTNKVFNNKFESIRIRTYIDGDYKHTANVIFVLKNENNKEEIYVTVHKNIYDLKRFVQKISIQIENLFNFDLHFYLQKKKNSFFCK